MESKGELTNRELEILGFIVEGASNEKIARILYISKGTVKKHIKSIFDKFHVTNRVQVVTYAFRHKLVQ